MALEGVPLKMCEQCDRALLAAKGECRYAEIAKKTGDCEEGFIVRKFISGTGEVLPLAHGN
jgi:hypothetical protein